MHRLKTVFFPLFISSVILVYCALVGAEESLSITTYYPSPSGIYNEMRLFPHATPATSCDSTTEGTMFYNITAHELQVCRGVTWGGGGGLWSSSGNNIYNTNTGNVGIGTNVPGAKLEVKGNVLFNGTVEGNPGAITIPNSDILVGGGTDGWFGFGVKDAGARLFTFGNETSDGSASRPFTMSINTQNKRVGIGTDNPEDILTIYGDAELKLQSDTNPANWAHIHFNNTLAGGRLWYLINYGSASAVMPNSFVIRENLAGGNRFVMAANGNFGIGNTWDGAASPSSQTFLHLKRAANASIWMEGVSPDIKFVNLPADWYTWRIGIDDSTHNFRVILNEKNTGDPDDHVLEDIFEITPGGNLGLGTNSAAYQLQLATNSAAKPTSNAWTVPSDIRVKKDIVPFTDGLEVIEKINPVSYELNGKAGLPLGEAGIGVVAQDIKDVAPYTINTWKAKLEPTDAEETELYDFDGDALTYVLINAIKEQQKQIKELRRQIMELKRK